MGYTNSRLVAVKVLSPNHSGLRTHPIDTISIHCVVGQLSAETIGSCFRSSSAKASCNYGVGVDGRIVLCVEEKNRSWCTSSESNDQRAITIEVACDMRHPYTVKDVVYNSLIKLVADICKRNGIQKLLWQADKSLIGNVSKQNMTVHRWFANKVCPGDYLYNRHSDIAAKVNALLGASEKSGRKLTNDFEYTVEKGDTIAAIVADFKAQGYGPITLARIKKWNKISDPNKIAVGQVLKMCYREVELTKAAHVRTGAMASKKTLGKKKKGTKFYLIGSKTNTKGNKWYKVWNLENGVWKMRYVSESKCKNV